MKYAQGSLEAVGQISSWVFTLSVTGHMFRNEKKHKACGGRTLRGDAKEGPCTDPAHVTTLSSEEQRETLPKSSANCAHNC